MTQIKLLAFQLLCLLLLASPFALTYGIFGVLAPIAVFIACVVVSKSLPAHDRKVALYYCIFFGVIAVLSSLFFLKALDGMLFFLVSFFLFGVFFLLLKFLLPMVIQAKVISWSKGIATVEVAKNIHGRVKPGVYVVECRKKKTGLVELKVQKGLAADKPICVV